MKRLLANIIRGTILALFSVLSLVAQAQGAQDFSVICDGVAVEASRQTGVPLSVLKGISLNETGRKLTNAFRPWPWTVNMEGKGHWFDSQDDARAYVFKEFKRGARSFDVGCFQINYKWHGHAFDSIDAMFDPLENALYAAKFLKELYAETGDWRKAAGAFHSRTPELAAKYAARFDGFRAKFIAEDGLPQRGGAAYLTEQPGQRAPEIPEIPDIVLAAYGTAPVPRINQYPFLQTGNGKGLSSLVPLSRGRGANLLTGAHKTGVE
ncbi:transglycosylase SLT domain-containing protein [Phaeovulum sp.]|uniref:transglycosylase SLT domain-containing protein n=1 Tax=Phaeovulum sp. TaxID=2934796 RepID=UPI0039E6B014